MNTVFWDAIGQLTSTGQLLLVIAVATAFLFEFINGFHDTANAVTTVIYTGTLKPTPAVLFSGLMNFLGVLLGGTAVAFSIVNLLPVDLLIEGDSTRSIVMVLSLLFAGCIWNLGTWWLGLPVSSSHTLIGSIIGVGLANSLMTTGDLQGVNWSKASDVGKALLLSPLVGFVVAAVVLFTMKRFLRDERLYQPPAEGDEPPGWVRGVLLATCGGVSFAHGSNDGQKGMGLVLLALIGFLPQYYSMDLCHPELAVEARQAALGIGQVLDRHNSMTPALKTELDSVASILESKRALVDVEAEDRWKVRQAIYRFRKDLSASGLPDDVVSEIAPYQKSLQHATEYIPLWVVIGVALALGIGTTIGYKRIVVTVAEKIGKTHLTYAQGAAAEGVAAVTIGLADAFHMPVSTTQVLSSGIAGTMWANRSGIQGGTIRKILIAWVLTLPAAMLLGGTLFFLGSVLFDGRDDLIRITPGISVAP